MGFLYEKRMDFKTRVRELKDKTVPISVNNVVEVAATATVFSL